MSIPAVSPPLPSDSVALGNVGQRGGQPTAATSINPPLDTDRAEVATSQNTETPTAPQPAAIKDVEFALEEVRKAIEPVAQNLLFSIEEDTGKTIVKVVDTATDEVIRQIPSEEIINIAKALDKLQGLLLQQKA